MADSFKKAAVWLGLMSDTPYGEDERDDEMTQPVERYEDRERDRDRDRDRDRPVEREREATEWREASRPTGSTQAASVTTLEPRRPAPVPVQADISKIVTIHPRTYNEARTIGEHFRDGVPVIMNLSEMEDADAKRLVDFAAGLIFGLRGTIERITSKVFLLSPADVNVAPADKERIASGEFFNRS